MRWLVRGLFSVILSVASEGGAAAAVQAVSVAIPSAPVSAGGNSDSLGSVISADGRFVLFLSSANNLVTNDDNGKFVDVFLRNRTNGTCTLVSVGLSGTGGGNGNSVSPAISADGRHVVFESEASNLVANDTNNASDIFVRDLETGTTTLVSVNSSGTGVGNGASTSPVISADGRYVAFASEASDLAANDTNNVSDVFVRDRVTGTTTLVSVRADGSASGNGASDSPVMTPDGRWVAFISKATNLVAGVANNQGEVYARDLVTGTTLWVGVNVASIMAGVNSQIHPITSYNPVISDDGKYVAFKSLGAASLILRHNLMTATTDLASTNTVGNTAGLADSSGPEMTGEGRFIAYTVRTGTGTLAYSAVYLWDAQTGMPTLVSANLSGTISSNTFSDTPVVSADGRFVTFLSDATDLVPNAVDGSYQVYQRDVLNGTTKLVSADTSGGVSGDTGGAIPTISADGRFVAFDSFDGGYVANDINNAYDVFVRDTTTDTTELVSQADAAAHPLTANGFSSVYAGSLSADGRFVAFVSAGDNVVANDTNGYQDVFVRDLQTGTNVLVSVNSSGVGSGNGFSGSPVISPDGRFVAFVSSATGLAANDTNRNDDIYVRDLQNGTTTLVSVSADGTAGGSAASSSPVLSSDGRYLAFFSMAKNLVSNDFTAGGEIFWRDTQGGITVSVSTNGRASNLLSMTADGRYVAYASGLPARLFVWDSQAGSNIYASPSTAPSFYFTLGRDGRALVFQSSTNLDHTVIARDLAAGTDTVIGYSAASGGPKAQVSDNGRFVVFVSAADAPYTSAGTNNVFLYDLQTSTTTLVSFNRNRSGGGNGPSDSPSISADGRFVTYRSSAGDLVTEDNNNQPDVFVFDRLIGVKTLVSVNQIGTMSGNDSSSVPVISADGSRIAFRSLASDLIAGDFNNTQDVFISPTPIVTFVDSDGDGMDDAWETAMFGDLSHDGTGDTDGDGVSDLVEYKTGTNPMDAASRLSAAAAVLPGSDQAAITWEAVPGRSYHLEYKNDLSEATWRVVPAGVMVNGSKAICVDNTVAVSSQRFYRVTLVQ